MSSFQRISGTIPAPQSTAPLGTTSGPSSVTGALVIPNGNNYATGLTLGNAANSPALWNNTANGVIQSTNQDGSSNYGFGASQFQATNDNGPGAPTFAAQYRQTTGVYIPTTGNSATPFVGLAAGGTLSLRAYPTGVGMLRLSTVVTSATTATAAQTNTLFDNSGAAAQVVVTLPASAVGLTYSINSSTAVSSGAQLKAVGSDKFAGSNGIGASAGTITSAVSGGQWGSVTVTCSVVGIWQVTAINGSWTIA